MEVLSYLCTRIKHDIPLDNIRFQRLLRFVALVVMLLLQIQVNAQNGGGKSSYSRFGIGLLNDPSQGWNRAMGGVGIALPSSGSKLNTLNPASYAHIDSLSFIMDAGMSANFGNMSAGGSSVSVSSASFDYVAIGFRLRRHLGISFGFKPYSTIDYNYRTTSTEAYRDHTTGNIVRNTTNYQGKGGLNQVFVGLGWKPFSNFSIGTNVSILWGGYDHLMTQDFTENGAGSTSFDAFNFVQHADMVTYKLDFGAQYAFRVSPRDWLTVGAAVGLGHKFDGDAFLYRFMTTGDTLRVNGDKNGFDLPMSYSAGVAWHHKNKLTVSADVHWQSWEGCRMPAMVIKDDNVSYPSTDKMYENMYILKAGAEYIPNPEAARGYHNRIRYRMGVSYSSPFMNIPQGGSKQTVMQEGPSELSVSLGLGLPITNRINNRSMVNVGLQWLRRAPAAGNLVTENYFVLNLGVTFNERWFMKFKIQ